MKIIKPDNAYKGTRILLGNEKRDLLDKMITILRKEGFTEIQVPNIQYRDLFKNKVGIENTSMMFGVKDNSDRDLVLAPEYTAVIQQLASTYFKQQKDVKLFYILECYRGEKPQAGRYRQFTQLGVEILNPSKDYLNNLIYNARQLITNNFSEDFDYQKMPYAVSVGVQRGLDYYTKGQGFEISCDQLGSQKQICGGGAYEGGIGFAIGIDRLLLLQ